MNPVKRHLIQTCMIVRRVDELGSDLLLVLAVVIRCHQLVHTIVDVCGVHQLQAAVVLTLGGLVDHGANIVLLQERHVLVVPLQVRLGVPFHTEWNAPVVVPLWLQQLLDGGGN